MLRMVDMDDAVTHHGKTKTAMINVLDFT